MQISVIIIQANNCGANVGGTTVFDVAIHVSFERSNTKHNHHIIPEYALAPRFVVTIVMALNQSVLHVCAYSHVRHLQTTLSITETNWMHFIAAFHVQLEMQQSLARHVIS